MLTTLKQEETVRNTTFGLEEVVLFLDLEDALVQLEDLLVLGQVGLELPGSLVPLLVEASQHRALSAVLTICYLILIVDVLSKALNDGNVVLGHPLLDLIVALVG